MSQIERGTIERQLLIDAVNALGINPDDVHSLRLDADHVEALVFARNEEGHRYIVPTTLGQPEDKSHFAKRLVYLECSDVGMRLCGQPNASVAGGRS